MSFTQLYRRLSPTGVFHSRAAGEEEGSSRRVFQTARHVKAVKRWLEKHRELIKDYMQIVAIMVAASWAIYQFYYIEVYKPKHTMPAVTIVATFEPIGRNDTTVMLKVTLTVKNTGSVPVDIMSAAGSVHGVKVKSVGIMDEGEFSAKTLAADPAQKEVNLSRLIETDTKIVLAYLSLLKNWGLEPGEEHTESKVIFIPLNLDIDLVVGHFRINVARDGESLATKWEIENGDLKGKVCLKVDQGDASECQSLSGREDLWERYGIAGAGAKSYFSLWELANKPSPESSKSAMVGKQ